MRTSICCFPQSDGRSRTASGSLARRVSVLVRALPSNRRSSSTPPLRDRPNSLSGGDSRSRDVHDELAAAGAHNDDLGLVGAVVSLAMDLARRQVDAVPWTRMEFRGAARSAFQMHLTGDHVDHRLMPAVVMPARRAAR